MATKTSSLAYAQIRYAADSGEVMLVANVNDSSRATKAFYVGPNGLRFFDGSTTDKWPWGTSTPKKPTG